MSLNLRFAHQATARFCLTALAIALLLVSSTPIHAQTTISTGSINGTITDPSGAVVAGAKITITNKATGQVVATASNSAGTYTSGALTPGDYVVRVESKGFKTTDLPLNVQVGVTASGNVKLQVGEASQIVEVQATEVQVNTEQASVQGVLNAQQIENLPVNGRNFLDLAQLEPGVQIQDGTNFDPTKVGYSSISFGGRFGRTARVEVDGVDISDETVGTTTQGVPASAIEEFQISQSNLDLSNELTSSGSVNVTTRSGTNQVHGEAFYFFRDSGAAAKLPSPPGLNSPFQRHQFGGRLGGPIIKDKAFFFIDGERTKQDLQAPVAYPAPFSSLSGTFPSPFRNGDLVGKVDYQLSKNARAFYRYSYSQNSALNTFFASSFQVYANKNYSRDHAVGVDFITGSFTHSVRFQYLKFQNGILDATQGLPFANLGIAIFNGPLAVGPNFLAPQATPQSDHQIKYDGSKTLGSHIVRYGVSYNHLQGGGFAKFFSIAPVVISDPSLYDASICGACPGGTANPLNYPVAAIIMGNGQGFSTEQKAFGFPAGGLGPDNRFGIYVGDSWKIKPNITISGGLRYVRDTGRTDSDLPGIPALNNLLSDFPNLGAPVKQPNQNFAPQLGVAWDPMKNGKTVIRAGIGMFYENVIWNNILFDRPTRLSQGAFLGSATPCIGPGSPDPSGVPVHGGVLPVPADVCAVGNSSTPITIGAAASAIAAFQHAYQAASPFQLLPNPSYIPTLLAQGIGIGTNAVPLTFGPNYQTPRSVQMNFGIQREIRHGMVFSADFVRNVTTHFLLGVDLNHTGDVGHFNLAGANAAITQTLAFCGVGTIAQSIALCPTDPANGTDDGGTWIPRPATMSDYAGNGLTSTQELGGPVACPPAGCAFPGINPTVGNLNFLEPIGRSVYNGLQMKLVQNLAKPMRGVRNVNFQVAYSLSRFVNPGGANGTTPPGNPIQSNDQDFVIGSPDNANPLRYMGPSLLDRTHQLSFGGTFDVPGSFRFGIISHFYSPLASPLVVPNSGLGSGEIFRTDFTGDGTTQDYLPGTKNGAFMRDIGPGGLAAAISSYNTNFAGAPTPAGQVLIQRGLFTQQQLALLGGVAPQIVPPVSGNVGMAWLRAFDLRLSWRHTFYERWTIEPSAALYNLFNFANFDLPPNILNLYLTGAPGSINGTNYAGQSNVRVGAGTGVFGLGAPRVAEFGVKLTF